MGRGYVLPNWGVHLRAIRVVFGVFRLALTDAELSRDRGTAQSGYGMLKRMGKSEKRCRDILSTLSTCRRALMDATSCLETWRKYNHLEPREQGDFVAIEKD